MLAAFAILFGRFFYLQVIQHQYYDTKAEDNRIAIVPIQPNRGLILDRNGVVLARNYSAYTLELTLAQDRRSRGHDQRARDAGRHPAQGPPPLPEAQGGEQGPGQSAAAQRA